MVMFSPLWLKASIFIMATSGIRIGGLTQLKLEHNDLNKDPQIWVIRVPPEASKTRIGYFSFITEEAIGVLKQHLDYREKIGEVLGAESPLIRSQKYWWHQILES